MKKFPPRGWVNLSNLKIGRGRSRFIADYSIPDNAYFSPSDTLYYSKQEVEHILSEERARLSCVEKGRVAVLSALEQAALKLMLAEDALAKIATCKDDDHAVLKTLGQIADNCLKEMNVVQVTTSQSQPTEDKGESKE